MKSNNFDSFNINNVESQMYHTESQFLTRKATELQFQDHPILLLCDSTESVKVLKEKLSCKFNN